MSYNREHFVELPPLQKVEIGGKRWYEVPGSLVPSVTTVLSHFPKTTLESWKNRVGEKEATRIKNTAGTNGKIHHEFLEKHFANVPDNVFLGGLMPNHLQTWKDLKPYLREHINDIVVSEGSLYSSLGYAGTIDLVAKYKGVLSVIDFKTSLRPKRKEWIQDYFLQAAAYSEMFREKFFYQELLPTVIIISVENASEDPVQFFESSVSEVKDHLEQFKGKLKAFLDDGN